jgi:hypothetical protein
VGKVIKFVDQIAKYRDEEAKQSMAMRHMNRWYFRNRRLMQERDEKRKSQEVLESERTDQ